MSLREGRALLIGNGDRNFFFQNGLDINDINSEKTTDQREVGVKQQRRGSATKAIQTNPVSISLTFSCQRALKPTLSHTLQRTYTNCRLHN